MFEKCILYNYEVEIDKAATRAWYAQAEEWGCECGDCLNFLELAKKKLLPPAILDRLHSLGISPEKATYVCHLTEDHDKHLYQFSYRIAGNILRAPENRDVYYDEGRCCHEWNPYGAPDFPEPHFDLEFVVALPWILS